jgi:hypothetical protein
MVAGSVKGLTSQQLEDLGCQVILGNTYHLENRPGGRPACLLAARLCVTQQIQSISRRCCWWCTVLSDDQDSPAQAASSWQSWEACTASSTGRAAC